MALKAIFFDLDSTLIDFMYFKKETAKAAAKAMVKKGLPATESKVYKRIFEIYDEYGIEYQKTFYQIIRPYNLEVGKAERIQQTAIVAYLKRKFEVLRTYPSVKPILKKLKKGYKLAIVTDAPRNKAWQRLVLCGLDDIFDVVVTTDDARKKKPHRAPFEMALKKLKIKPSEALFVGDNVDRDMLGAKRIGMKTCLAKYGVERKTTKKMKTDYTIKEFKEISRVVE